MKQLEQKTISPIEAPNTAVVSVMPITASSESEQALGIKEKAQDLKKFKQTDKLIKAITDLSTLTKKKVDAEKKDTPKTVLGFLGSLAKGKLKEVTGNMTQGLLGKVGLGKNQAIGGYLAERKKLKLEDLQSKADFRTKIATHTEVGRELTQKIKEAKKTGSPTDVRQLEEQLTGHSLNMQAERTKRTAKIEKMQKEKSEVTSLGMNYAGEEELQSQQSKQDTQFMTEEQKEKHTLEQKAARAYSKAEEAKSKDKKLAALHLEEGGIQPSAGERGKQFLTGTAKISITEPKKISAPAREGAPSQNDYDVLERKIAEQLAKESGAGPKELIDVNEKQLEALNKLVAATTVSEEDKLEAKKQETNTIVKEQAKPKEEPKGGLLDSLKDMLMSKIPGKDLLTKLPKMLPALTSGLSAMAPAAGVAAAGTAGYMIGKHVVNPLLNAGAEAITGTKGETVGTAVYKGVDKVTGWFGSSDEDKQKEAVQKANQDLYNKRVETGTLTPKSAEFFEKMGIKVDKSKISTVSGIEKPITATREIQTAALEQSTSEAASIAAKETAGSNKGPAVVDASVKSVTNNNTIQTRPTPPVRNFEPTFNSRLKSQFA